MIAAAGLAAIHVLAAVRLQAGAHPPGQRETDRRVERFLDIEKHVADPIFRRMDEAAEPEPSSIVCGTAPFRTRARRVDIQDDGGGGRYGGRFGGKKNLVARGGGSEATEQAVLQALQWLARHQNADGSWSMEEFRARCTGGGGCDPTGVHESIRDDFDVGLTALAVLTFLGAGYTHVSKEPHGDVVRKGVQYLTNVQHADGCVDAQMYNHAIAATALAEAYGLTGSNKIKEPAQRAIDYLVAAQNPGKGWRYGLCTGENDTSVTAWAVMALKSADLSGIDFERQDVYDGARAWLDEVSFQVGDRWKAGYQFGRDADVFIPNVNEGFDQHPTMTAIAMTARIFMDKKRGDPKVAGGAPILLDDLPRWDGNAVDFYYWYHGSIALYQFDGPDGAKWKAWNKAMVEALVPHQNAGKDECRRGSWEPEDRWSCKGGRVYATAINALTLEVYYRYASVFGPKKD